MKLTSHNFRNGAAIPERNAFARPDPKSHAVLSDNKSPELSWTDVPAGTKSLVLICRDSDAPTRADDVNADDVNANDVNKPGRSVPVSLPRADFAPWVLLDLTPSVRGLAEGEFSQGVTARGKRGPAGPNGARQGLNGYTQWFQGDKDMEGTYYRYHGPCPPRNDERIHHYHLTPDALDVERCPLPGEPTAFGRDDVLAAIAGHVLARVGTACWTGTQTLNPKAR